MVDSGRMVEGAPARARPVAGSLLPGSLLPGSLLVPEDPSSSRPARRTMRDWLVDGTMFVLAIALGVGLFAALQHGGSDVPMALLVLDVIGGAVSCLLLWWRRRWPVGVATVTAVLSAVSALSAAAAIAALFTVAVHRRTGVAVAVAIANVVAATIFTLLRPQNQSLLVSSFFNVAFPAVFVAWGLFVRARRQLIWTLRERAERAEGEQRMLADRARLAERTRIAREMHDVLAHRISLVALHAGGLQVRPDLGPDQVRETATLLRETAQQALEELRGVIGVLRGQPGDADAPSAPQPTLCDIPRLVDQSRRAGAHVDFVMDVPAGVDPPGSLGRDAYRIVQEALTNVAKHAHGTATSVRVTGAPGDGLRVTIGNRLPLVAAEPVLPGSGSGLLGLGERVSLAGGTLEHGPDGTGDFVVDARLTW